MTKYLILQRTTDGFWAEALDPVEARSGRDAVRQLLSGENGTAGEFVAVPVRSWKPVTAKVETKTSLKFS